MDAIDQAPDGGIPDAGKPHSARVWNYLLGGEDNTPADRAAGRAVLEHFPDFAAVARHQRLFLRRAVRFLAEEAGLRQFLDIGTGLPTADNTHQVAQRAAPDSRIVYVDHDPLVLRHAERLLTSTPEGSCAYLDADVRDPEGILARAAETLDLTRPVGLMLFGVMGQIPDEDDPWSLVRTLTEALPAGSHLALTDGTDTGDALNEAVAAYNSRSVHTYHLRSPERIAAFFDGFDLLPPGLVR
ncbi:SAM-dependent methyltransferase, partial [Streptomyces sp. UH6]|uniref:SAM-dependent methyltransferase n=1 Tax=Streptomyces sp. UH6 TaxID=2748379 RepID=UPI0015D4ABEC